MTDGLASRPVGLLWVGAAPSAYEHLSLSSFVRTGHAVNLFTYDRYAGLPEGVERRDAREILPEEALFRNAKRTYSFAMFSDWFRYRMIRSSGYVWADADMVSLAPLPDRDPLLAWNGPTRMNGALLYMTPASPLIEELIRRTEVLADPDARDAPWETFGPLLLTDVVVELGLDHHALPTETVHPIDARSLWRMFDPSCTEWCEAQVDGALTLHLWNSKLQQAGIKDLAPPSGSYLAKLMIEHDVPMPAQKLSLAKVQERRRAKEDRQDVRPPSALSRARGRIAELRRRLVPRTDA